MSPPEPSIIVTDDYDSDYDAAVTFFTDFSLGSLFTKAILLILLVFFVVRLTLTIIRRVRRRRRQLRREAGDDFTDSFPDFDTNPNDVENPVVNEADIEAAIKMYPSFMYNDKKGDNGDGDGDGDQNNTECPICMCEYREGEMMRRMPQCGHYFHLNCIDDWLRIKWSCPVCRDSPSMPRSS